MQPFSYTGLKIVQDQMIEEALERYRVFEEPETQKRVLFHAFGEFLAHFTNFSARTPEEPFPGYGEKVKGTVS